MWLLGLIGQKSHSFGYRNFALVDSLLVVHVYILYMQYISKLVQALKEGFISNVPTGWYLFGWFFVHHLLEVSIYSSENSTGL